jgi:hypothetical protein
MEDINTRLIQTPCPPPRAYPPMEYVMECDQDMGRLREWYENHTYPLSFAFIQECIEEYRIALQSYKRDQPDLFNYLLQKAEEHVQFLQRTLLEWNLGGHRRGTLNQRMKRYAEAMFTYTEMKRCV